MYLKRLSLQHVGPIDELFLELPFHKEGSPKPVVFVGENGSGKTIVLSCIVDGLFEFGNKLYDDVLPKGGSGYLFFRVCGPSNRKVNCSFSLVTGEFEHGDKKYGFFEKTGQVTSEGLDKIDGFAVTPNSIEGNEKGISPIDDEQKKLLREEFASGSYFYQPAYRYEEPFWKNDISQTRIIFEEKKRYASKLDKEIEILTSSSPNKAYLLDLVLDFINNQIGQDINKWNQINIILRKIKKTQNIRFGIGPRTAPGGHRVSIVKELPEKQTELIIPSIDNLSLGETLVMNLFLNILRHSDRVPKAAKEMTGIVLIDEIDVHLHSDLQKDVLPELLKFFPKIQFIITTHSPLFLLGMQKVFDNSGYEIIELPSGNKIQAERFSEFEKAYMALKETERYDKDIKEQIALFNQPVVFVEGPTDVKYINRAIELFDEDALKNQVEINVVGSQTSEGTKNSNNRAMTTGFNFLSNNLDLIHSKILFLFDPEEKQEDKSLGRKLHARKIPDSSVSIIKKGIEVLFPKEFIEKAQASMKQCFKVVEICDGEEDRIQKISIRDGYKMTLCDWICDNALKEDFENFVQILDLIKGTLIYDPEKKDSCIDA